nr:MAG TPA: hypothetical protein [Caudoviricetes sp.]
MEYYGIHYDSVIEHHGIKGQKWGIRRYQNPDGTLTEEGKKRLGRMSPDAVRKEMQKAVNKARSEKYGFSNRWRRGKGIGEQSEKVHESQKQKQKAWETSESYKRAVRETDKLDKMFDQGKISVNDYDQEYAKAWDKAFENAPTSNTYTVSGKGRKYVNDYAKDLGRKLTVAYLGDLGFDKKTSEYIDSIIKKSGAQVLD